MEVEEEVQHHNSDLAALNTIFEIINRTLSLDKILEGVLVQTQTMMNVEAVWIYLVDQTSPQTPLELKIHQGLSTQYVRGLRRIAFGDHIKGAVAAQNKAYFIDSLEYSGRYHFLLERENLQAYAAVPLSCTEERDGKENTRIVGTLCCAMPQRYARQAREIRLLTTIANQVLFGH